MLIEWLVLVAIILVTRALHCYLHYRAERAGVPMPVHQDLDNPLNQLQAPLQPQQPPLGLHEIARAGGFLLLLRLLHHHHHLHLLLLRRHHHHLLLLLLLLLLSP